LEGSRLTYFQPIGASPSADAFFQYYLAAPIVVALYLGYKVYSRHWAMWIRAKDMDVTSGRRSLDLDPDDMPPKKTWKNMPIRVFHALF
jgi:amino acid transporter